jgi:hypothetical protein
LNILRPTARQLRKLQKHSLNEVAPTDLTVGLILHQRRLSYQRTCIENTDVNLGRTNTDITMRIPLTS